jgi:hypothetical protein
MQIIYAIFVGWVIREGAGKLTMLGAWAQVQLCDGVGATPPRYSTLLIGDGN